MKTLAISYLLILPTLLVFSSIPWIGAIYLAALVWASKKSAKLGRFWLRAYKETLKLEERIFKN